jgi:hypothetical protein
MTEPTPTTPEKQNLSATPDSDKAAKDNSSTPERDGFFRRVRRELKQHPTEAEEIVVDSEGEGDK